MSNILTVTSFEFEGFIKKKKNWVFVIIIGLLSVILALSPLLIDIFSNEEDGEVDYLYIYVENSSKEFLKAIFGETAYIFESENELNEMLSSEEVDEFYKVTDEKITLYTKGSKSMLTQPNTSWFSSIFSEAYFSIFMTEKGLEEEYRKVNNYINNIEIKEININEEGYEVAESDINQQAEAGIRYIVGYFFVMLTYISMMQYGSYAATAVGNEKASRTMESLIYATDTNSLILGKVFGVFCGSIIQVIIMCALLFGGAFTALNLVAAQDVITSTDINQMVDIVFNFINIEYVLIFILLYGLGFLISLFIFASFAATVSKVEEISSAISSGTIITMLSFFIGIGTLMTPETKFLQYASYVPFFTPLAMFARYTMDTATTFDLIYAIVVSAITVVATGLFAAKLYKLGVLLYGTKPNFKTLMVEVFKKTENR